MVKENPKKSMGLCPTCGRSTLESRFIHEEFDYGPEEDCVRVMAEAVPVLACPACDEIFYGPEAEREHDRAIRDVLGLLTPEQIRKIRERLGMSQAEFSRLSGIGVATLSRLEKGRLIQSRSLDNYLRLLDANPDNVRVLVRRPGAEATGNEDQVPTS